jgi:hypothetical protein
MSGLERRLKRLEGIRSEPADEQEEEREAAERERIRETAEHINHCRDRDMPPLFEIAENGDVFCAYDGKPVTDWHQTGAEQFYWMEVGFGGPGLIHDEEAEAFYTPEGKLTVSRDRFALRHLLNR